MPTKTPENARRWIATILEREPTEDESASARAARALVTVGREPFNVEDFAASLNIATTSLYLVLGDLRRAGYPFENVGGRTWVLTGDQGPDPVPVGPTGRKSGALVHVGRANGVKLPAAFLRPPPEGLPALGEVLRVAMLAEADGGEALVLQAADGRRFMVHVDA